MEEEKIWALRDKIMVLQAVQVLEHHDRNWLGRDNARVSEEKIKLVAEIMDDLMRYHGISVTAGYPMFKPV